MIRSPTLMPLPIIPPKFHYDAEDWDDRQIEAMVNYRFAGGSLGRPVWRYDVPRTYNGADGQLRITGWQVMWGAVKSGMVPGPKVCSVCLREGRHQYHNENYYRPANARPICRSCHQLVHQRFEKKDIWRAHVERHAYEGAWFVNIATRRELTQQEAWYLASLPDPLNARQLRYRKVNPPARQR